MDWLSGGAGDNQPISLGSADGKYQYPILLLFTGNSGFDLSGFDLLDLRSEETGKSVSSYGHHNYHSFSDTRHMGDYSSFSTYPDT